MPVPIAHITLLTDKRCEHLCVPPENTAYQELIPAWNALGVKVNLVHSGDSKQYVQVRQSSCIALALACAAGCAQPTYQKFWPALITHVFNKKGPTHQPPL